MHEPSSVEHEPAAARTMSLAEWAALPEDEPGELVDGHLVGEEVPDCVHEIVVAWLTRIIGNWLAGRGGFVGGPEARFAVSARRGRKPDVFVFLPGGRVPPRRGVIRVPPDIMVEVLSPAPSDGRRDRVQKMDEYAAFGVRHYWLVDPQLRSLEIFELAPVGMYLHARGATDGTIGNVPGCEGLSLDLDQLWAEIDRLGPEEPEPPSGAAE
jgi:Uma2 family endonuclease